MPRDEKVRVPNPRFKNGGPLPTEDKKTVTITVETWYTTGPSNAFHICLNCDWRELTVERNLRTGAAPEGRHLCESCIDLLREGRAVVRGRLTDT